MDTAEVDGNATGTIDINKDRSWDDIMKDVHKHVVEHGSIDVLVIMDHCTVTANACGTGGKGQQIGSKESVFDKEKMKDLAKVMPAGGVVVLIGCHIGSNANYCRMVRDTMDVTVIAGTGTNTTKTSFPFFEPNTGEYVRFER